MIQLSNDRLEQFDKAVRMREESTDLFIQIWKEYHLYTTLEYWMMASVLVVPLLILFFKIDKSKIFLIGFFGYSFHVVFAYIDLFGMNAGYWHYPFQLIPTLPSLSIDASLVPVTFMLVYQWTINHKKNYYLYAFLTSGGFSFVFKPLLVELGLFRMYENKNYLHLLVGYIFVSLMAKFMTNVFLWTQKKYEHSKVQN
jgi:hypothetical protein